MAKMNICFIRFKIHSKNSKNSALNPTPKDNDLVRDDLVKDTYLVGKDGTS